MSHTMEGRASRPSSWARTPGSPVAIFDRQLEYNLAAAELRSAWTGPARDRRRAAVLTCSWRGISWAGSVLGGYAAIKPKIYCSYCYALERSHFASPDMLYRGTRLSAP